MAYWSEISSLFTQFFRLTRLQESTKERKLSTTPISQCMKHIGRATGQSNRRCKKEAIWVVEESYIGRRADLYWSVTRPILLHAVTNIGSTSDQYETIAGECCPLFRALRHRAPSPPIYLSKVTDQALRLIASIPLIQRRERCPSHEEKSVFP